MQRLLTALIALCALITAQPCSTFASILYDQPFNYNGNVPPDNATNPYRWYDSTKASSGIDQPLVNIVTTFDDFVITNGGTVTEITWMGLYHDPDVFTAPGAAGWTIAFWSDSGNTEPAQKPQPSGLPGTSGLLLSEHVSGTAVNETAYPHTVASHFPYTYDLVLPTPFVAAAGTTYWVSIVPDLPNHFSQLWSWLGSRQDTTDPFGLDLSGNHGEGFQYNFAGLPHDNTTFELTFSLLGNEAPPPPPPGVPEPASLTIAALGLLGLSVRAVRRRS